MEKAFQEYVRGLVRELHPAIRVEFLPARDIVHSDPIYPVRFETETASLMVGFPQRMVLSTERKAEVHDTVARVVRLLGYFKGKPAVGMVSQAGSGLD
jgi:hypothetical protein